jgi:predicted trehalose synthase
VSIAKNREHELAGHALRFTGCSGREPYERAMHDRPQKDLAGIVASLIFAATIVALIIIGAVTLSA